VDWTVIQPPPAARSFALHLRDADGTTWAQADANGYLAEQWRVGDRVTSWFTLDLDRAMPPGDYTADLMLLDEKGEPLPWTGNLQDGAPLGETGSGEPRPFSGLAAPVATIRILPKGARRAPEDAEPIFTFPDGLAILDTDLPEGEIPPGGAFKAGLDWARLGATDGPADLQFALDREGTAVALPVVPIAAGYPPSEWLERELLRGRYVLRVPAHLDGGEYRVRVIRATPPTTTEGAPADAAPDDSALDADSFDLGTIRVGGGPRSFEPPPMAHASGATFGASVRLLGYDLEPAQVTPGAPLTLTLYWLAIETPTEAGKVFAHLFGPDGRPVAQHDGEPAEGARPFTGWLPGEVVADRHVIEVPADVDVATLALGVGVYDPATGERWPVSAGGGGVMDGRMTLQIGR